MERKNVLLVKTISRYASNDKYIEEWASAIRKLGCNTCVLDAWSLAQPALCNHVLSRQNFDAVFDVNGVLCTWGITKNLSPETVYAIYMCDPPTAADLQDKLEQADERTIVFGCDRNFCDYIDRYIPAAKHTKFIPLSGSFYPMYVPYEERTIDIVFTGTYQDPEVHKQEALALFGVGSILAQFVEDMLEDIIVNPQYTLPECLTRALEKYQVTVSDEEFHELCGDFLVIDFYARFYYRDKVIRSLLDAGLKIDVFGNGWENFISEHKENLIIHQGGSYAAGKALANAKIALNIMPWFKDAFQERIASAMLSGTVAVTDESKYIADNFENNKELLIFSLKDIESLPERVWHLLEHPDEAAIIAENGREKVKSHTWFARTCEMMRSIEQEFGVSLIQEGEGRELEFELEYPNQNTVVLDAVYELHKMAALAENDLGKMESISKVDLGFLRNRFKSFNRKFSNRMEGLEMSGYMQHCLDEPVKDSLEHIPELFSLQCKALIGELFLKKYLEGQGMRL